MGYKYGYHYPLTAGLAPERFSGLASEASSSSVIDVVGAVAPGGYPSSKANVGMDNRPFEDAFPY